MTSNHGTSSKQASCDAGNLVPFATARTRLERWRMHKLWSLRFAPAGVYIKRTNQGKQRCDPCLVSTVDSGGLANGQRVNLMILKTISFEADPINAYHKLTIAVPLSDVAVLQ